MLIANKVTTHFFITLSKSIDRLRAPTLCCTSFSLPTAFSGLNPDQASLYTLALAMVTCFGPFVTIICKSRQARKGATVAGTLGAKVC